MTLLDIQLNHSYTKHFWLNFKQHETHPSFSWATCRELSMTISLHSEDDLVMSEGGEMWSDTFE
jgi:hypothetical protein